MLWSTVEGCNLLIDDRGRLFGKVNVLDAAVLLVVCLLIPLTYGAYLLFRPVTPRLVAIEPVQIELGTARVSVSGEDLRPNLRVLVGDFGARFLLADSEHGVVELPGLLVPGSYDVVLLDEDLEIGRLPGALTVVSPPEPEPLRVLDVELVATGSFPALDSESAQALWKALQAIGEDSERAWSVLDVQPPEPATVMLTSLRIPVSSDEEDVRALLRFRCSYRRGECTVFDTPLVPGAEVAVPVGTGSERAIFRIDELHPVYTSVVDVTLRATGCSILGGDSPTPEELSALREAARTRSRDSIEASVLPIVESIDVAGGASIDAPVATVHLSVPVVDTGVGLVHRSSPLRTGDVLTVSHRTSVLCGRIIAIGPARTLDTR